MKANVVLSDFLQHIPFFEDVSAFVQPLLQPQRISDRAPVADHFYRELLCEYNCVVEPVEDSALEQPELRRNLLSMAIECISALHVAPLSACGREAAIVVYNTVTHQASKMRDVICMFSRELEEAVFCMHRYLIEMLPVELLASYLLLLRHTRLLVRISCEGITS
ncbi:hypothetical protein ANCCAN_21332 [Ancylostoma caninum]|uniref:KANSL3 helical domain-containing protein n=1 Tax=Ancylostoma caninum TaxID=29170 RepID=A0A368FL31_ANCCA|nr:hypothetical protein ANCCAN_21332 [Ancylostoma caninum]